MLVSCIIVSRVGSTPHSQCAMQLIRGPRTSLFFPPFPSIYTRYDMMRSTVLYTCNNTGMHDVSHAIKYGTVVYVRTSMRIMIVKGRHLLPYPTSPSLVRSTAPFDAIHLHRLPTQRNISSRRPQRWLDTSQGPGCILNTMRTWSKMHQHNFTAKNDLFFFFSEVLCIPAILNPTVDADIIILLVRIPSALLPPSVSGLVKRQSDLGE